MIGRKAVFFGVCLVLAIVFVALAGHAYRAETVGFLRALRHAL